MTLAACSEIARPGYHGSGGGDPETTSDGTSGSTSSGGGFDVGSSGGSSSGEAMPDGSSGSSSDASSSGVEAQDSSSGEVFSCDLSSHVCVPSAPAGWSGPVARAQVGANAASACGGAFGNAVASGGVNLVANPASCDCDCGNPHGDSCDDTTTAMYYPPNFPMPGNNVAGCQFLQNAFEIGALAYAGGNAHSFWRFLPVGASGGSCTPMASTTVPSAYFGQRLDLCGPTDVPEACDDGSLCMPNPDEDLAPEMCVWRYGDVTCPAAYPEKQLTHNGISDGRSCSSCTCGTPSGQTCPDATAYLVASGAHSFAADGSCVLLDADDEVTGTWFEGGSPEGGSCTPSSVHATGSASATDALTVCCAG